ncbi:MAG: DinB family protein [Planctomycetes bacterium]|nr:DinB family protein [Planctomycetota bacterium]
MRTNTQLVQRNTAFLAQALTLLESLSPEVYAAREAPFDRGGVGAHLRHVLDHYDAFLEGAEQGCIDYDARRRDSATEAELEVARARLRRTLTRMEAFQARGDSADRPILVVMDAGGDSEAPGLPLGETPPPTRGASSVGRELQYLIAHTVHHFALMAVALRLAGFEPHADFGVAPSTLRFEARNGGPCVR